MPINYNRIEREMGRLYGRQQIETPPPPKEQLNQELTRIYDLVMAGQLDAHLPYCGEFKIKGKPGLDRKFINWRILKDDQTLIFEVTNDKHQTVEYRATKRNGKLLISRPAQQPCDEYELAWSLHVTFSE